MCILFTFKYVCIVFNNIKLRLYIETHILNFPWKYLKLLWKMNFKVSFELIDFSKNKYKNIVCQSIKCMHNILFFILLVNYVYTFFVISISEHFLDVLLVCRLFANFAAFILPANTIMCPKDMGFWQRYSFDLELISICFKYRKKF